VARHETRETKPARVKSKNTKSEIWLLQIKQVVGSSSGETQMQPRMESLDRESGSTNELKQTAGSDTCGAVLDGTRTGKPTKKIESTLDARRK
jgi:hypothetical protein